jgi:NADH-quinone oxidoreductase subunit L
MGTRLQDGDMGKYAWMLAAGALALIAALTLT